MRVLSTIKSWVVPGGTAPRTIQSGIMHGLRMHLDLTCETQLALGLAEREVQGWLRRLATGARGGVDIGAGAGELTLYFLARTKMSKVFAFEPITTMRLRMVENLSLNNLQADPRLELRAEFVGRENGPNMVSLDALLTETKGPLLVKLDVDGAEMDILNGAHGILARPDVRWLVETHTPQLEKDCIATLHAAGYATRIVPNAWWRAILPEMRYAAHRPENHNRWLVASKPGDMQL